MDLGQLDKSAPRIKIDIIPRFGQTIRVGDRLPEHHFIGVTTIIPPILLMAGADGIGNAVWIKAKGIVIDNRQYDLEENEWIMARFNYMGISPLLQTAPPEIQKQTGLPVWPIVRTMFKSNQGTNLTGG